MPASKKWKEIVRYLAEADVEVGELADATAVAAEDSLALWEKDPAFIEALWLLVKIPQAAREKEFAKALRRLGLTVPDDPTITDVVVGLDAAIEAVQRRNPGAVTDLSEMARHAAVAALHGVATERLPDLWTPCLEDQRTTLGTLAAPDKFAEIAQRFFAHMMDRNIQYFLARETPKHIGPGRFARSVSDLATFDQAVTRHCEETSVIMRPFARDWLGNNAFHLGKDISRQDVARFGHVVFQKIRKELMVRREAGDV
jgi:hypothetical protein